MKTIIRTLMAACTISSPVLSEESKFAPGFVAIEHLQKFGYISVNGKDLFYAVFGEGEPLVLLHGGIGQIEMFGPVLDSLAEHRQVIAVDLPGHGRSLPVTETNYPLLADDIFDLIEQLEVGPVDVMGYSVGGNTALRLALNHPESIDQLVLVSTPYAFSGWHDYNAEGMRGLGGHLAEEMKQSPYYPDYVAVAPDPDNWVALFEQMATFVGKDYDLSAEIPGLRPPTLLVVGDYDSVRISHATSFFEMLGGGQEDGGWDGSGMTPHRLAVLPGATHYSIYTDPRLAETALEFLQHPKAVEALK